MVKYKNKLQPWKYIVVLPVGRNPIKISSPNLAQLKPVHEGIRRVLLAQQRDRGGGHDRGHDRSHDHRQSSGRDSYSHSGRDNYSGGRDNYAHSSGRDNYSQSQGGGAYGGQPYRY